MSALAHLLLDDKYIVRGLDINKHLENEDALKNRGVQIDDYESKEYLSADLVIIGHSFIEAIDLNELRLNDIPFFEYHKFLAFYLNPNTMISICGSHGKTTLVEMLKTGSNKASFLKGDGVGKKIESEKYFFLESCEYQDHFLSYSPEEVLVTNIDYDHVDYFKTPEDYLNAFQKFVTNAKVLFIPEQEKDKLVHPHKITFATNKNAIYHLEHIYIKKDMIHFDFYYHDFLLISFTIPKIGIQFFDLLSATLAFYHYHSVPLKQVVKRLKKLEMPKNRMNIENIQNTILIKDYAHHPTQMKMNYLNLEFYYPHHKKIAIYKPDRSSRLVYFKDEIKRQLNRYDYAFVLDYSNIDVSPILDEKIIHIDNINQMENYIKFDNTCISFMTSKNIENEYNYLIDKIKRWVK